MTNISGGELMVLAFIALVLIGPERLPQYAQQLARLVKALKEMMSGATVTLKEELGDDYAEIAKFDPRQYDPRRIVREALLEDVVPATKKVPASAPPQAGAPPTGSPGADLPPLFDDEAT